MDKDMVSDMLGQIMGDRGVPRNVRESLESNIHVLDQSISDNEKISRILSILDDASNDPNMSMSARTLIWNTVSAMEGMDEE